MGPSVHAVDEDGELMLSVPVADAAECANCLHEVCVRDGLTGCPPMPDRERLVAGDE